MAKITPGMEAPRGASLRNRAIYYYDRGRWLVRKWPKPSGPPKSLKVADQVRWFKETAAWIKYADPEQYLRAMKIAEGTRLYPRDVLMKAAAGNLYDITMLDGSTLPKWQQKVEPVSFQGFRLRRTANLSLPAATFTMLPWQVADIDTGGGFNLGDPTWWQCPTGVNMVDFHAQIMTADTASAAIYATIRSNGPIDYAIMQFSNQLNFRLGFSTGPIAVAAGVKYGLQVYSSITRNLIAGQLLTFSGTILDAS